MTAHADRRTVPYSADAMFDLVADIDTYPDYIPWCVGMRVRSRDVADGSGEIVADMLVGFKVFRERFRSRVHLDKASRVIVVDYISGPFRKLENRWRFEDLPEGGSIIDFHIEFEFKNRLLQATAMQFLDRAFTKLSDAFLERADEIYGPGA